MPLNRQQPQAIHVINMRNKMPPKVFKESDIEQYHKKAGDSQEKGRIDICAKSDPVQENKVKRTRSGCIVKK